MVAIDAEMRSFVFATDYRVLNPDRVWDVLQHHHASLVDLGATYVCQYGSTIDPTRVFVAIGVRSEQPLLDLARSRYLLDWFDAVGVEDIPAVFVGQSVDRFDIGADPDLPAPKVIVVAVTSVTDVAVFVDHVEGSIKDLRAAGIRKTLIYSAFDTDNEVMFLQELADEDVARRWSQRSDVGVEWLAQAGIGVYPPVFVGTLQHMRRFNEPSGRASGS